MILCLGTFALPDGILASGFATEFQQRNPVVIWPRAAAIIAVTECRHLALYAEDFEDLLIEMPELRSAMPGITEQRPRNLEEHPNKAYMIAPYGASNHLV